MSDQNTEKTIAEKIGDHQHEAVILNGLSEGLLELYEAGTPAAQNALYALIGVVIERTSRLSSSLDRLEDEAKEQSHA